MAAGMRIEPPPSLALAAGTIPDATAAADHEARLTVCGDYVGVVIADVSGVLEGLDPEVVGIAGARGPQVFQEHRHPTKRTIGEWPGCDLSGLLECRVDHRIDLWIERLDPADGVVDDLQRAEFAGSDELCQRHRVEPGEFGIDGG